MKKLLLGVAALSILAVPAASQSVNGAGVAGVTNPNASIPAPGGNGCPAVGRYFGNYLAGSYAPGFNSTALTENTVYATPIQVSCAMTIDKIVTGVLGTAGAAGSVIRFGLYADNGAVTPGTLVEDCGTATSTSTFAAVQVTCGTPMVLSPGLYWCGEVAQAQAGAQPIVPAGGGDLPGMSAADTAIVNNGLSAYTQTGVTAALPGTWAGTGSASGDPGNLAPRCFLHRSA